MALINCPECGKEISNTNKKCIYCGYKLKKQNTRNSKKSLAFIFGIVGVIGVLAIFFLFICPKTVPWFCYHKTVPANCFEPKRCVKCRTEWGEKRDHEWIDATCTEPETCTLCGETRGSAKGHSWGEHYCDVAPRCIVCGEVGEDLVKSHNWIAATCEETQKCRDCPKIGTEKALGHNIEDYKCTRCFQTFVTKDDVPNILDISTLNYEINILGGYSLIARFKNKGTKTINYIKMKVQYNNAVGDVLTNTITNETEHGMRYTGPLKAGKTSDAQRIPAVYLNGTVDTITIKEILIEYEDGSELKLDQYVSYYAVVPWRKK